MKQIALFGHSVEEFTNVLMKRFLVYNNFCSVYLRWYTLCDIIGGKAVLD